MSEHPIVKHAMKGYKAWKNPNEHIGHRLAEVLIEIAIIVFAVTFSFALERWRDNSSRKEIEKQFFISYKTDLIADIKELKSDSTSYSKVTAAFNYFLKNDKYAQDSIKYYYHNFFSTTDFVPNISRFEALKSSGNLDVIKNKQLLDDIVSLYSEAIPNLTNNTGMYSKLKTDFIMPYLYSHMKHDKSNIEEVLHTEIGKNYLGTKEIAIGSMKLYHIVIVQAQHILDEINEEQSK